MSQTHFPLTFPKRVASFAAPLPDFDDDETAAVSPEENQALVERAFADEAPTAVTPSDVQAVLEARAARRAVAAEEMAMRWFVAGIWATAISLLALLMVISTRA